MPLLIYLRSWPGLMMTVRDNNGIIDSKIFKRGLHVFKSQDKGQPLIIQGRDIMAVEFESEEDWRKRMLLSRPPQIPPGIADGNGGKKRILTVPGKS